MKTIANASQQEYHLQAGQNLLSRTDLKGRITYAAPDFIEVSGFSREELIGAPHSIVRHPDMPKEAFADLWYTLQRGEVWVGLVKNRRKNGEFYWVRAHVAPIIERGELMGYTSVRVRPSEEEKREAEEVYRQIREGQARGLRLEAGRITRTGLLARLRRINPAAMQTRLYGAIAVCVGTIAGGLGVSLWSYSRMAAEVAAANAAISMPVMLQILTDLQAEQSTVLGWQIGLSALAVALLIGGNLLALRSFLKEVRVAQQFSMQIASGNLAAEAPAETHSELGQLTSTLGIMQHSLSKIVIDVDRSLDKVRPSVQSIANGSDSLAAASVQQAASLQQTAASIEQITATVHHNSDNARHASQLAETATQEAQQTGTAMSEVVSSMQRIGDSSERIAQIVKLIDSIAFQTNILALNASIEAARSGVQGRGFAVVAAEVRKLAGHSTAAAADIRRLVDESRAEVRVGADHVQRAEQAMSQVIESITKVNDLMAEIAAGSREQTMGIAQVNSAAAQMDSMTQGNAELAAEAARSVKTLEEQVSLLGNAISVLRLGSKGAEHVDRAQRFSARKARGPRLANPLGGHHRHEHALEEAAL